MKIDRSSARTGFVFSTICLSVLTSWLLAVQTPVSYRAHLVFQMAVKSGNFKPNIISERELLKSDALLVQVLNDANLLPPEQQARFRSFDLGPDYKVERNRQYADLLKAFRKNLGVKAYPEPMLIEISYQSPDAGEARKIVESVFSKFRDWRQSGKGQGFDGEMIKADKNLAEKREIFLNSQKAFLEFVERRAATPETGGAALAAKKTELDSKIAALRLRYGPKHPVLQEALRQQEIMGSEKPAAIGQTSPDQIRIAALREKMESDFQNLDAAIRKAVETEQKKDGAVSSFEILPLGDVTIESSAALLKYKILFAALAGFFASLVYLKFRTGQYPVFETPRDLERIFNFPGLGKISGLLKNIDGELPLPAGSTADALKTLRQELKLRAHDAPIKLVTFTSTLPGEGRTELVAGLGRIAARNGEKVVILDADLRSPTFQSRLPLKAARNLVDYLSGQSRLEDIILRGDPSGVHVIFGTAIPNTALDLLSSEKMKTLLLSLREVYDLVLVQAPVALRGPDARVLAALSDQTLYLIEAGKTGKKEIEGGLAPFRDSNIGNLSFVLTEN